MLQILVEGEGLVPHVRVPDPDEGLAAVELGDALGLVLREGRGGRGAEREREEAGHGACVSPACARRRVSRGVGSGVPRARRVVAARRRRRRDLWRPGRARVPAVDL